MGVSNTAPHYEDSHLSSLCARMYQRTKVPVIPIRWSTASSSAATVCVQPSAAGAGPAATEASSSATVQAASHSSGSSSAIQTTSSSSTTIQTAGHPSSPPTANPTSCTSSCSTAAQAAPSTTTSPATV